MMSLQPLSQSCKTQGGLLFFIYNFYLDLIAKVPDTGNVEAGSVVDAASLPTQTPSQQLVTPGAFQEYSQGASQVPPQRTVATEQTSVASGATKTHRKKSKIASAGH